MLGKPKYNYGEKVCFKFAYNKNETKVVTGTVEIMDRFGVFEDNSDVYYDIYVESEHCLYKHIREDSLFKPDNTQDNPTEKS